MAEEKCREDGRTGCSLVIVVAVILCVLSYRMNILEVKIDKVYQAITKPIRSIPLVLP